ncbi:EamA family transporter, partial [Methylobacterium trifolii]
AVVAGERITPVAILGIALVSGGILSLALARGARIASAPVALLTGCFIAGYTIVDGIGVRLTNDAVAYTAAMSLGWGALMPFLLFPALRRAPRPTGRQVAAGVAGGIVSILAYGIVIWAMQRDAMGMVSALRETSVLFAAVIGRVFLGERLTAQRLASCAAIALGAGCLALAS